MAILTVKQVGYNKLGIYFSRTPKQHISRIQLVASSQLHCY